MQLTSSIRNGRPTPAVLADFRNGLDPGPTVDAAVATVAAAVPRKSIFAVQGHNTIAGMQNFTPSANHAEHKASCLKNQSQACLTSVVKDATALQG